jgi:hypothetical protein
MRSPRGQYEPNRGWDPPANRDGDPTADASASMAARIRWKPVMKPTSPRLRLARRHARSVPGQGRVRASRADVEPRSDAPFRAHRARRRAGGVKRPRGRQASVQHCIGRQCETLWALCAEALGATDRVFAMTLSGHSTATPSAACSRRTRPSSIVSHA